MNRKKYAVILTLVLTLILSIYLARAELQILYGYSTTTLSRQGSRGQEVRSIQTRLKNWGYYYGAVDGIYGYQTYRAVILFQQKNGLTVDGIAGSQTLYALGLPTGDPHYSPAASRSSNMQSKDVELLSRLVHAEAKGEPYTGMVAVAAVVLNRVRDSRFPSTIAGVVYQPGAFTPVSNGQINAAAGDTSIRAARDALNGWDPTNGCIYFWNPATATSKWVWSRPIVIRLGKHVFAK